MLKYIFPATVYLLSLIKPYLSTKRSQTSQVLETQEHGAGRDFQTCQIQSLLLQQHITTPFWSWSPCSLKSYLDFCPPGSCWVAALNLISLMVWSPQLISNLVYSWPVYIHLISCQHCPLAEIALLPPWCLLPGCIYRKPSPAFVNAPVVSAWISADDMVSHFPHASNPLVLIPLQAHP